MDHKTELTTPDMSLLLTFDEAAEHLRCTRRHFENLVKRHDLATVRLGRSARVERTELNRLIELLRDRPGDAA